ncbi:MAG: hypothetical protein LLG08_03900 [Actinomycetia bacterium]|nr:hypothetical protein [Actinomycetes bacterium]
MSETTTATEAKAAKKATVYLDVTMTDGRVVKFPEKRKTDKTILEDAAGKAYGVRFDFVNGETRTLKFDELSETLCLYACGHGIAQKAGDEYSGVPEVDDMVLAVDEIFTRLRAGDWAAAREAGDSMAGASIVIRAIMEDLANRGVTRTVEWVKDFLNKKLEKAKAAGEKLSRNDLYNSFRNPTTPTGKIIKRLEEEKLAKATAKVNTDDYLAEMGADT